MLLSLLDMYRTARKNSWTTSSWEDENSSHCGSEITESLLEYARDYWNIQEFTELML